ncbi:unnamed protein product [Linum trigynum]|uniref:Uncharacterized protein n=1 Tax=Linum trigynum TaxID=586398 RepID=A0AAV2C7P9_9ROSI
MENKASKLNFAGLLSAAAEELKDAIIDGEQVFAPPISVQGAEKDTRDLSADLDLVPPAAAGKNERGAAIEASSRCHCDTVIPE